MKKIILLLATLLISMCSVADTLFFTVNATVMKNGKMTPFNYQDTVTVNARPSMEIIDEATENIIYNLNDEYFKANYEETHGYVTVISKSSTTNISRKYIYTFHNNMIYYW